MAQQEKNIISQQLVQSYLSSVISISLVLLLIGITGFWPSMRTVSDYFKEHLGVCDPERNKRCRFHIDCKQILATKYVRDAVKDAAFISKDQGAAEMAQLLGSDFLDIFEYNPLPASVELSLNADYVHNDSIARMGTYLSKFPFVEEVSYQAPLISLINKNLRNIGIVLGVIILILLVISFALIHNTIRLSVYARRFTIYTMRLVGATKRFIRKPFMLQAFIQGFISSLIAILLLMGVLYLLQREFPGILMLITPNMFLIVIGAMIVIGVLLCRLSTYFVVNRVVKLKASAFYY